jgi:hypothetical protein
MPEIFTVFRPFLGSLKTDATDSPARVGLQKKVV